MSRLVRAVAVIITNALMLVSVSGCSTDGADSANRNPRIPQYPREGDGWAAMSLPNRRADQPTIFDAIHLCIDRPGSVQIVDVNMEHTQGGFFVQAFATRPVIPPAGVKYSLPSTSNETLWDIGYQQGNAIINTVCDQSVEDTAAEHRTQVGVQFSKPTDKTARGAVLHIAYRSGDKTYSYRMGFEAVLCETEESNPECETWDYDWTTQPVRIVKSTAP